MMSVPSSLPLDQVVINLHKVWDFKTIVIYSLSLSPNRWCSGAGVWEEGTMTFSKHDILMHTHHTLAALIPLEPTLHYSLF